MELSWIRGRRTRHVIVLGSLALLYVLSSWIRLEHWPRTGLYHSDSAFRFRYARMYAEGEDIPTLDHSAQFPEGLEVRRHIHLAMQAIIGHSFRIVSRMLSREETLDFTRFTVYWLCLFSSLTVFGVYVIGRGFGLQSELSALASAFYGVSTPAFARTIGNYLPEEFVLPLLFGSLGLFLLSLKEERSKRKRIWMAGGAALFLFVSLVSWHLSQFFYALFVGFSVFLSVVMKDNRRLLESFSFLVVASVAAGAVSSVLRAKLYLLSIPMLLSYSLLVSQWLAWRLRARRKTRLLALAGGLLASGLLAAALPGHYREFSHVYLLLLYKLRFLGSKPADPAELPYHARVFWVGPFRSPTAYRVVFDYIILLPLACWPIVKSVGRLLRRPEEWSNSGLVFWFATGAAIFLLVRRLEVFFIPFLALFVGQFAASSRSWRRYVLIFILAIGWGLEFHKAIHFQGKTWMTSLLRPMRREGERFLSAHGDELERAIEWMKRSSGAQDAVLARFDVSGTLLAYAGRPVVLNPMFENYEMRERVKECWGSLFGDEESLYRACAKYRTRFLLYQAKTLLDDSQDSDRYTFDRLDVDENAAVQRLHFEPDRLEHFELVYQSTSFRIYTVGKGVVEPLVSETPSILFNGTRLLRDGRVDSRRVDEAIERLKQATAQFNLGVVYANRGDLDRAIEEFRGVLRLVPNLEKTHSNLGHCFWRKGDRENALKNYEIAVRVNPWGLQSRNYLGILNLQMGKIGEAAAHFEEVLRLDPENVEAHLGMAEIFGAGGDFKPAKTELEEVLKLEPGNAHAHFRLGLIYLGEGDRLRADEEFRRAVREDSSYLKKVKRVVGEQFQ